MIHLKCPRGHALSAPDDKVGKSGKCPECGVRFRVPSPGESRTAVESASSGSGSELQRAEPAAANLERPIVFLCPNGHRLNGPARLAGKPGQCPHCQERFLIPTLEELAEYERQAVEANGQSSSAAHDKLDEIEELAEGSLDRAGENSTDTPGQREVPLAPKVKLAGDVHRNGRDETLAAVFTQLWGLKRAEEAIEITLKSGQSLLAERFSPANDAAALVASRQADGKLCVTAIAWDAVATMQIRNVDQLPHDLFKSSSG